VAVEAASVDEPYLGSDSARVCVRLQDSPGSASPSSSSLPLSDVLCAAHAVVACVDLAGAVPRVFIASLLLLGGRVMTERVKSALASGPQDHAALYAALDRVPELRDLRDNTQPWLTPDSAT
jgi:hypothetical protein